MGGVGAGVDGIGAEAGVGAGGVGILVGAAGGSGVVGVGAWVLFMTGLKGWIGGIGLSVGFGDSFKGFPSGFADSFDGLSVGELSGFWVSLLVSDSLLSSDDPKVFSSNSSSSLISSGLSFCLIIGLPVSLSR